jgi:hypothetical protein
MALLQKLTMITIVAFFDGLTMKKVTAAMLSPFSMVVLL